ncbi:tetraspanin 34 [Hippoglossus hippoglossus]|uniref:tetraspanin 34 n=1 Tax=Hippoglossus hippoglossus TaxID=8267 RepID=UPI00148CE70A|nr:tetraspanin 34 [Hippoglossus hippoglossus]XP_035035499.1 tetraspanin 34 [Hippoglossus stenolepis]
MCCSSFLKMMMFIFNGGIFLAGGAILGVGVWVKVDSGSLLGILDNVPDAPAGLSQLVNVSYLLIAVGAVLLVIGFLGCCGAMKESRCMLLTFFSIVLIIFIIEVAGAVVLLVFQNVAEDLLQSVGEGVKKSIEGSYGEDEGVTSIWDSTMEEFTCCGFNNYTDFDGSPFNVKENMYPIACCNSTSEKCSQNEAHFSAVDGCYDKLLALIENNAVVIAGVALGIVALEIAAMTVSMVLYKDIGNKA